MTLRGPGAAMGEGRAIAILALAAIGWLFMLSHLLSAPPGSMALAGPGMQTLEALHRSLRPASFLLDGSLCLTVSPIWTPMDFARAFAMWGGMALGMMLPTLLWSDLPRGGAAFLRFLSGYLLAWTPFYALAVLCQWLLRRHDLLNEHMVSTSWALNLCIFALIGLSSLKREALRRIARRIARPRSEAAASRGFACGLAESWACAPIMASMFVFGLMNLVAMAALTAVMIAAASQNRSPGATRPRPSPLPEG